MSSFVLSCGSTVDVPFSHMEKRGVAVIFYNYTIDGVLYEDDMGRTETALPEFYKKLDAGALPNTSLINKEKYIEFFENQLQKGDLLHIAFTSGMSGSCANAISAGEELRAKYPDKKIYVIDSLCASSGYGLLVDMAADLRDQGKSIEEVAEWVLENRGKINHHFFTGNMTQFKRTGRVSGPAALAATVLNICPMMFVNHKGSIIAHNKVRGKKKVMVETVNMIMKHIEGGSDYKGSIYISNSMNMEEALMIRDMLIERIPGVKDKVEIFDIGTTIASHTGRGTVAIFFVGDQRQEHP